MYFIDTQLHVMLHQRNKPAVLKRACSLQREIFITHLIYLAAAAVKLEYHHMTKQESECDENCDMSQQYNDISLILGAVWLRELVKFRWCVINK